MDPEPRAILCDLVAEYGPELCRDARRCEALLRDHCGRRRREVNILVAGVRGRVGADLLSVRAGTPRAALLARLTNRLCDEFGMTGEAAGWAVTSWAVALGVELPEPVVIERPPVQATEPAPPATLAEAIRAAGSASTVVNPVDGATLLRIPAGEFQMGDDDQRDNPRHGVYLDSYWIYKTPVTGAQYVRFCEATGHPAPDPPPWAACDDRPAVNVTWADAAEYARWAGASLPTEAQWEKAARCADGRLYPWGNRWDPARCIHSVAGARTGPAPAGSLAAGASPYGALDMAGNVWEWCADWYDAAYWKSAAGRNPAGPPAGDRRVLRGGSWTDTMAYIFRTSMRFRYDPEGRFASFGFRCAAEG
ncbi:MAG TPA: SUMF1/EgtB/PvdO family nonheme iron enzyme [Chthonomonadaceae bacterium]|nr:SUMF1/EgtB/PvdO family nonheme iron enzyme [Chthonomonadaceae bacterium]